MSLLIELKGVDKTYQIADQYISAIKTVYFNLQKGEMAAIVGASGSGKSTLMNIIGFLDRPTAGTYFFEGLDVSHLSDNDQANIRNRKIGFVFQSFFLLPRKNALENVMLPLIYRGISRTDAQKLAFEIMEKVGVSDLFHHLPNQLSGGQQQRVAIARALVGNPELILADEPTGALDSKTGKIILDLFLELNQKENKTILIITHDKAVSNRTQRIVKIQDGRVNS